MELTSFPMLEMYDRFGKISMGDSSYRNNMMTRQGQVSATYATFFTASGSFLSHKKLYYSMYGAVCLNFILLLFWFLKATFCYNFYKIF